MKTLLTCLLLACAATVAAAPAPAPASAPAPAPKADPADPRVALAAKIPDTKPEDFRPSPIAGLYEFQHGMDISYVSADGRYIIGGDLYQITTNGDDFQNLSENRRRELRTAALAKVPESQMVVFGPKDAKHTITVFTDVDCSWCRKLHSQIADYNKAGIRVRYLFFPRSGPDTESWFKAESVWCARNRQDALTRGKRGEELKKAACGPNPVQAHFDLGRDLGVRGTPGVVLDSGELIPGYLSPAQLVAHMQQQAAARK